MTLKKADKPMWQNESRMIRKEIIQSYQIQRKAETESEKKKGDKK